MGHQVLRSGTAMAANYRSACWARSPADYISKIAITVEEAYETAFWLELNVDAGIMKKSKVEDLIAEANELGRVFEATRTTARSR